MQEILSKINPIVNTEKNDTLVAIVYDDTNQSNETINQNKDFKRKILWTQVLKYFILHLCALYGFVLSMTTCKPWTVLYTFVLCYLSGLGVTAGAHRLWSHRSYKAKWPFRLFLAFFQTMAFDKSIYKWCIDHRIHHKYSETISDPHNIEDGFFFSHFGWRMLSARPEFSEKINKLDMSDLENDKIVMFQDRFWLQLVFLCCFISPVIIPYYLFEEDLGTAFFICVTLRWFFTSHLKWTVNSIAHRWGQKPYDQTNGNACENDLVIWATFGEGYHNYHHTFPWDYKTSELDWKYNMNLTAALIDFGALIGQVSDRKTASDTVIEQRRLRTGIPKDPNVVYKKRNFFKACMTIICFIIPAALWIFAHWSFNELYYYTYGHYLSANLHHHLIDYLMHIINNFFNVNKL